MTPLRRSLLLLLITLVIPIARAQQPTHTGTKITGMYSDMTYHAEGGDVLGTEVFLVYSRDGYRVIYQSSEGEPSVPVVIPAKVQGDALSFSVPADVDPRGTFTGTIQSTELVGSFSGNGQVVHLPRRASYWQ